MIIADSLNQLSLRFDFNVLAVALLVFVSAYVGAGELSCPDRVPRSDVLAANVLLM